MSYGVDRYYATRGAPSNEETDMRDIDLDLNVELGSSVKEAVQHAFALVRGKPGMRVVLEYETMCSSGKFLITSESSYDDLMAAFDRAQNHTGEFKKTYDRGVVIGP